MKKSLIKKIEKRETWMFTLEKEKYIILLENKQYTLYIQFILICKEVYNEFKKKVLLQNSFLLWYICFQVYAYRYRCAHAQQLLCNIL